jgi:hypothetical protein
VESVKVGSTLRLNAGREELGFLWQPRFFDRASRRVKEYYGKVEYIHLNPVRAGVVERAQDRPWLSVRGYTGSLTTVVSADHILAVDRADTLAWKAGISRKRCVYWPLNRMWHIGLLQRRHDAQGLLVYRLSQRGRRLLAWLNRAQT